MWRLVLSGGLSLSVLLTTFYTIGVPKSTIFPDKICVYQRRHYEQKKFDSSYVRKLLLQIPDDAYVCAASMFVPHLALRDRIEDFDWNPDTGADYVLIPKSYFGHQRYGKIVFGNLDDFEVVSTDGTVFLLKRIRK